jgi:hypothetical protein
MQKMKPLLILAVLAPTLSACYVAPVRGSGKVVTDTRSVSGFSAIEFGGAGRLIIEQNGREELTITTDDNLLQFLGTEVEDGTLRIGVENFASLDPSSDLTYRLSVKNLGSIRVAGGAEVDVRGVKTDELSITVNGAGQIRIAGAATRQNVTVSGAAEYRAADFKTSDTTITITGAGEAVVAAEKTLDVRISGAADVEYIGDPTVTRNITGLGTIRKRTS